MLDHMSHAGFTHSQFIEVHNAPSSPPDFAKTRLVESIEKDSHLNGYKPEDPTTIDVPRFTFDIISCLPVVSQQGCATSNSMSPTNYGSCAFDLAQSLSLLPSQEYGVLLPMVEVEVHKVSRYNDRYCGYLSRHGLVLLASRYAQRVSMASGTSGGIVLDTSLGRFKVFEHDHRTHIHFDSGIRTAVPDVGIDKERTESMPDMDVIRRVAGGQHFVRDLYAVPGTISTTPQLWTQPGSLPIVKIAILAVLQDFECSVFLPTKVAKEWEEVAQFSRDMIQAVSQIFFSIQEPKRVVQLRDIFSEEVDKEGLYGALLTNSNGGVEQGVAEVGYIMKYMFGNFVRSSTLTPALSFDAIHTSIITNLAILGRGHTMFRAATLDLDKLRDTSDKRFLALFEAYKTHNSVDRLEEELRKLLHKNENICLVLWQGVLATVAYWNARKAVQFGIEAPEEWIQFALAQDSDILIG